jgi:hypothetical protein
MAGDNPENDQQPAQVERPKNVDFSSMTAEERINMVWQLTIEEYARNGIDITKQTMRKDVERLIRLHEK